MRLADSLYALNATPVTEGKEAVLAAWMAKYRSDYPEIIEGFPKTAEAQETAVVFKLSRRG
ncbi:MAG: hypothetical protein ACI9ON_002524 [Limisphaerales bacterium]